MTRALIIVPPDDERLQAVALRVKNDLEHLYIRVHIINLEQLSSPEYFLSNDIILIGNPCVKGDIFWPMQIRIDGLINKVVKGDLLHKLVSGFTISSETNECKRTLNAVLWTFNETSATVVNGLVILETDSLEVQEHKIKEFVHLIMRGFTCVDN